MMMNIKSPIVSTLQNRFEIYFFSIFSAFVLLLLASARHRVAFSMENRYLLASTFWLKHLHIFWVRPQASRRGTSHAKMAKRARASATLPTFTEWSLYKSSSSARKHPNRPTTNFNFPSLCVSDSFQLNLNLLDLSFSQMQLRKMRRCYLATSHEELRNCRNCNSALKYARFSTGHTQSRAKH